MDDSKGSSSAPAGSGTRRPKAEDEALRTTAALRMRTEQLEAFRATTADLTSELDLTTVLGLVARRACELTGATAADIDLWDSDRQILVPEASFGHAAPRPTTARRLGEGAMGTVAQTCRGMIINDYRSSPVAHPDTLAHTKITASIVEPLLYRDTLLGVIGVDHETPGRTFTEHDQALLRLFADQAVIAVQNARLYDAIQRELRQREEVEAELRTIIRAVEQSSSSVVITDSAGAIEYVNPKFTELTGYPLAEARGQNPRILKSGHTSPSEYARLWATLAAGHEWRGEFQNRRKDGTLYWEAASISPVRNADGEITHYVAVKEDITAQKAVDAALRRSMSQLEAIRATTADITRELDLDRLLHLITGRAATLLGLSHGAVHLWDESSQLLVTRAIIGYDAWRADVSLRLGDGVIGTVAACRKALIENEYRTSALALPIFLERSQTTAMVAAPLLYRERLLGVLALTNDGTARCFSASDLEFLTLFADQAAIAIENAWLFGAAERRRREAEVLASLAQTIMASLDLDTVLQRVTEGAKRLCDGDLASIALREADDLAFRTWAGTVTPAYTALRIPAGRGLGGRVLVEGRAIRTTNYPEDPTISPDFHDVARSEGFVAEIAVPIRRGGEVTGVLFVMRRTEHAFSTSDEATLTRLADQAAIAIENARLYTAAQQALADLQQAQGELVRTEKLHGLGQMAAGIAHDLNNTLSTIIGQAELLRLHHPHAPEVAEGLQMLQTAANDGAQVVRRLQDFARQRVGGSLSPCDLTFLVSEALEITRPRWREESSRKGIVIDAAVDLAGLPMVQGNAAEIRQVLTNLIFNAVDAMPNGGTLRVTGGVVDDSQSPARARQPQGASAPGAPPADPPAEWVELAVRDTGIGMAEDVRRQAFDPFFTTKGLHGTGLGLSVAYGIMERHRGQIDVTSAPGKGTTVHLRFRPAAVETASPTTRPTPSPAPARRILLVDDDAAVRITLAGLLRASGHNVVEVTSGAAALRWLEATPVDLVLTDLGMPDVNGWDVARAAKAHRPDLPVVLITGWGDQPEAEAPPDAGVDRVLTKPAPVSTVLAVIAELTGNA